MERGTAAGVLRGSRPAGFAPEDATGLWLVAVAWRHGDTVPSLGATARQHSGTGLGLHARAEAMRLGAVATVGLEGTLGHRTVLIRESLPYGQVLSIADPVQIRQSSHSRTRSRRTGIVRCPFSSSLLHAQQHGIAATNRLLHFRESSASLAALLRVHRICIVNSSKNLSIAEAASRVFTSSGATRFFADKAAHSMLPSVLVSAPFTTEFSGVMPNSGLIERQRTDSPSRRDSGRGAKEAKS